MPAPPPVEITGPTAVPEAGDLFEAVEDERSARELAEQRIARQEKQFSAFQKVTLDNLFSQMAQNAMKRIASWSRPTCRAPPRL